jgi:alkylhydroperoxidase family enzyme
LRERELVVLRVAQHTSAAYEWGGHALAAQAAGMTAAEIRAVLDDTAAWSTSEAALLQAVDELCADNCVSDTTWATLSATRDDQQVIEVLVLTGFYRMNAGILNSLGVQPDSGMPSFGEPPAPPTSAPPETTPVPADDSPGYGDVGGTWQVIFHHPKGDQQLTLVLSVSEGIVSGSVTNSAAGITVVITSGRVDGSHFSFASPMTSPVELAITYTVSFTATRCRAMSPSRAVADRWPQSGSARSYPRDRLSVSGARRRRKRSSVDRTG